MKGCKSTEFANGHTLIPILKHNKRNVTFTIALFTFYATWPLPPRSPASDEREVESEGHE